MFIKKNLLLLMTQARALLEQGRLKNPKKDQLWLLAVLTERKHNNTKVAESLMAKALQVRCSMPSRH